MLNTMSEEAIIDCSMLGLYYQQLFSSAMHGWCWRERFLNWTGNLQN